MQAYEAIVLAGGLGRRLGGADKAVLELASQSLLSRALNAVRGAEQITVVGPPRDLPAHIRSRSEDPPGGGPVAAVAAVIDLVETDVVVVLACDMPFVSAADTGRLVEAVGDSDAAMFRDAAGRRQFLAAAYRSAALQRAIGELGTVHGAAMRDVVSRLTVTDVTADPETTLDIDTWDDIARSREILEDQ